VLIVTKPDITLIPKAREVVDYLLHRQPSNSPSSRPCLAVYLEDKILEHPSFLTNTVHATSGLKSWNADALRRDFPGSSRSSVPSVDDRKHVEAGSKGEGGNVHETVIEDIDFVITLGGDGTVLYASWLFQGIVPPILPFHLGSLGFLTVFDFNSYKKVLDRVMGVAGVAEAHHHGPNTPSAVTKFGMTMGVRINLRMRFNCEVYRYQDMIENSDHSNPERLRTRSKPGDMRSLPVTPTPPHPELHPTVRTLTGLSAIHDRPVHLPEGSFLHLQ
jgi:hypothetical protein